MQVLKVLTYAVKMSLEVEMTPCSFVIKTLSLKLSNKFYLFGPDNKLITKK